MEKPKLIKDTVHGYIEVEPEYLKIINSLLFQRLRRIEQTSYRVIYPSARHDRFIHSIGTFYLGKKAFYNFKINIKEDELEISKSISDDDWKCYETSFYIACLLHDIGHAPFSHTCEDYFEQKKEKIDENNTITFIDKKLNDIINKRYGEDNRIAKRFRKEYENLMKKPSPHEIVSSIIMAEEFGDYIKELNGDIELAVRMIIGCPYIFKQSDGSAEKHKDGIKNCLIRLLNSSTIDVDKLDYITRDTKMTGYDNVTIDTERLLRSVTGIIYTEDGNDLYPAFRKTALSVVENVVAAKNSQNSWIVGHHAVVYEAYLIQASIKAIAEKISDEISLLGNHLSKDEVIEKIFSIEAIKGCVTLGRHKICYLSDDDIWCLFKEYSDIGVVKELLDRSERKHPIWKSFAEYNYMFRTEKNGIDFERFNEKFKFLINKIATGKEKTINDVLADKLIEEYGEDNENLNALYVLKNLATDKKINNEFVLLKQDRTEKKAIIGEELFIRMGSDKGTVSFDTLMGRNKDSKTNFGVTNYFYIYHKQKIDKSDFLKYVKEICNFRPQP